MPISYGLNSSLRGAALSQLNASCSTVVYDELQGFAAQITNPAEQDSPISYVEKNATSPTGTQAGTTNHQAYATGSIGGHIPPTSLIPSSNGGLHNDGADYLAKEGHVKFLRPGAVFDGPTAASDGDCQDQNGDEATVTNFVFYPTLLSFFVTIYSLG